MHETEELTKELKIAGKIGKVRYHAIAGLFERAVRAEIKSVFDRHGNQILMAVQGVNLCAAGSTVNSSTAIGYLLEEFITRQLPADYCKMTGSTTVAAADFHFADTGQIELYVNLKAEKATRSNKAVCAAGKLTKLYARNSKPKLMLIFKVCYDIDVRESTIRIRDFAPVFLESFILGYRDNLRKDQRNWSKTYKPESGRLLVPEGGPYGIAAIPDPDVVHHFVVQELPQLLKSSG